ncbi:hypothetical protein CR513_13825, partial [Mucuna pruriens]
MKTFHMLLLLEALCMLWFALDLTLHMLLEFWEDIRVIEVLTTRKMQIKMQIKNKECHANYKQTDDLKVISHSDSSYIGCIILKNQHLATLWLMSFMSRLRVLDSISKSLKLYYDNSAALFMTKNNKCGSRNKHINIKYLAIRECVKEKKVVIEHVNTRLMIVDPISKGMPQKNFKDHVVQMGLGSIICTSVTMIPVLSAKAII